MEQIVFLHVPHTGGRSLKREFDKIPNEELKVFYVHNDKTFYKQIDPDATQYFILRPTVERVVGHFLHYSYRLKTFGVVNNLNIRSLPKNYNFDSPIHFINLEENRNMYCKFLLNFKNFKRPMTLRDFAEIKKMFEGENPPIWDMYGYPNELPNLKQFLGREIDCMQFVQTKKDKHDELLTNERFVDEVKKLNSFDEKLYEFLTESG